MTVCGEPDVSLQAGPNAVDFTSSPAFLPDAVVLSSGSVALGSPTSAGLLRPDPSRARVDADTEAGDVVVLRQNANRGWQADAGW